MGPKKRGARKRKSEKELEEEEADQRRGRRRMDRGTKKYIGAHVAIKGNMDLPILICTFFICIVVILV